MICLLILLLCSTVFGSEYDPFLTENTATIARINAGDVLERDIQRLKRMRELRMIVAQKAYEQRHPYRWLMPRWVDPEFALRNPKEGKKTDLYFGLKVKWDNTTYFINPEQQNGVYYFNQRLDRFRRTKWAEKDLVIISNTADGIDRQTLSRRMRFWKYSLGWSFSIEQWDIKQRQWYFTHRITFIQDKKNKESVYINQSIDTHGRVSWDINVDYWHVSGAYYYSQGDETYKASIKFRIPIRGRDG